MTDAQAQSHKARRSVALNAAAAVGFVVFQTATGLALYSYLIRTLGADTVGVWVALMAAGLLACMADLGLNHALIRAMPLYAKPGAAATQAEVAETLVGSVAGLTALSMGVLVLGFGLWSHWLTLAPTALSQAGNLLPFVAVGLWLNRVSDACAGALEGQQRYVLRSVVGSCACIGGLVLTVLLAGRWGMEGAGLAFVLQHAGAALANLVMLQRSTPGLRWWRPRFRKAVFAESVRYGLSVQWLVFCYLLLESGTKLTLVRAGHLSAASYFDMVFRIGRGIRGLLSSGLRVLVPRLVTELHLEGRQEYVYSASFGVAVVVALPVFALLLAGAPLLSWVLIGQVNVVFIAALALCLSPWLAYCLTDPALNNALATGRMRWALYGHLATVVLAALWAALAGPAASYLNLFAMVGVAMLAGCLVTLAGVHHAEHLAAGLLRPTASLLALAGAAAVALLGLIGPGWAGAALHGPASTAAVAAGLAYVGLLWWRHPEARRLIAMLLHIAQPRPAAAVMNSKAQA